MEAAHLMQAKKARQRRHAGIALLVVVGLLVLFAPALWGTAADLMAGEPFLDMPVVMLVLSLVFLSALFAVLMMQLQAGRRGANHE
jgi:cytochrome bd-type quinol oxidase subunit 2